MTAIDSDADWVAYRRGFDRISDHIDEWQGIPVPLPDMPLRLHDRHPLREAFREIDGESLDIIVGGPPLTDDDEDEELVNSWFCARRNVDVYLFRRKRSGRAFAFAARRSPDSSMDRLTFWLSTLGASDAWDVDAEHRAREKLHGLLTERQWRHYDLTGAFLETSPRSRLTYVFRRLRPTVVLTPRWPWYATQHETMKTLAVLCMHPIGYYQRSWAGCLVPSDDVIAHLIYMRADEAGFWRIANQHPAHAPEAGL